MRVFRDVSGAFIAKPAGTILPVQPFFEKSSVLLEELFGQTKTNRAATYIGGRPPSFHPSGLRDYGQEYPVGGT